MQIKVSLNQFSHYYVNFAVFLFFGLSVAFEGSYAISGAVIVSTYLLLFIAEIRSKISLSGVEKGLISVLLVYLVSVVLEVIFHEVPISKMDPQGKVLLFLPFILVLNAVRIHYLAVIFGIAAGALGLFLLAMFEIYYLGVSRVGTNINAIQLGNIALSFGLLAIFLAPVYYVNNKNICITVLLVMTGFLGVVASALTLTRGGFVFLPLILIIAVWYYRREIKENLYKVMIILLIVVPLVTIVTFNTVNVSRFTKGLDNTVNYFQDGNANTSSGIRLELWKTAAIITMQSPVFGVGFSKYMEEKKKLVAKGEIYKSVLRYSHSHNAYFYAAVRRGGAGLLVFLALLFYPVYVGHKEYRKGDNKTKGIAISLVIFALLFIFANMTQVLFAHNSGMIIYLGSLIIIIALLASAQKSENRLN